MTNSNRNSKIRIVKKMSTKISITPLEEKKKMLTKTIAYNKFESSPKSIILPKKGEIQKSPVEGSKFKFKYLSSQNCFIGLIGSGST